MPAPQVCSLFCRFLTLWFRFLGKHSTPCHKFFPFLCTTITNSSFHVQQDPYLKVSPDSPAPGIRWHGVPIVQAEDWLLADSSASVSLGSSNCEQEGSESENHKSHRPWRSTGDMFFVAVIIILWTQGGRLAGVIRQHWDTHFLGHDFPVSSLCEKSSLLYPEKTFASRIYDWLLSLESIKRSKN